MTKGNVKPKKASPLLAVDETLPKAPLNKHYRELRIRLMISVAVWLLTTMVSFCFAQEIFTFLVEPLFKIVHNNPEYRSHKLIYTNLTEGLMTHLRLAMFAGFVSAFPVIAFQLYFFLAPGLYRREKYILIPYLIAAPLLFLLGAMIVYYIVVPIAWNFFLSFENLGSNETLPIMLEAKISEYLSLMIEMILGFGIAFQLPVVLALMAKVGVVSHRSLVKMHKYAIVAIFIMAALLTPPDVISQITLALPLLLLYEVSIFICKFIEKNKS